MKNLDLLWLLLLNNAELPVHTTNNTESTASKEQLKTKCYPKVDFLYILLFLQMNLYFVYRSCHLRIVRGDIPSFPFGSKGTSVLYSSALKPKTTKGVLSSNRKYGSNSS